MLLEKGLVGRNDLAIQVTESGQKKAQADWKLLWQFPEFDRRSDAPEGVSQPIVAQERREPISISDVKKRVQEELPTEILNLAPEDLIPKTTGPTQVQLQNLESLARPESSPSTENSSPNKFFWMVGASVAMVGVASLFLGRGPSTQTSTDMTGPSMEMALPEIEEPTAPVERAASPGARSPSQEVRSAPPSSSPQAVSRGSSPSSSSEPTPPPKRERDDDRGYVREERESNRDDRDRDEEERANRDEEGGDDEPREKKPRKPAKKRLPERESAEDEPAEWAEEPEPEGEAEYRE